MGCETSSLAEDGLKLISVDVVVALDEGDFCAPHTSELDVIEVEGIEGDTHFVDTWEGDSEG